ncbi:MAG: ROK family protein [Lachnospiraceae bacterium]|nr:ROK family protein [Lachnospiraceae bacterium]
MRYGALEAGGTKMVCVIGDEKGTILEKTLIPTRTPDETLPDIISFFKEKDIEALGIACFGPVDLDPSSETYGYITTTPKQGWENCDIIGILKKSLNVPVGFDTDVNGSLLGEVIFGQSKGLEDVVYITIGTGIGGGVLSGGKPVHGMLHPELGHMLIRPRTDDPYEGKCPYHRNCLEGMASGPAITDRYGIRGEELDDRQEVWDLEAYYLGQAIVNIILTLSPRRIILGGGVMEHPQLFDLIHNYVQEMLGGYIKAKELEDLTRYIVPASLKGEQGIKGCLYLADMAYRKEVPVR